MPSGVPFVLEPAVFVRCFCGMYKQALIGICWRIAQRYKMKCLIPMKGKKQMCVCGFAKLMPAAPNSEEAFIDGK